MNWKKKASIVMVIFFLLSGFTGLFWYPEIRTWFANGNTQKGGISRHNESKHKGKVTLVRGNQNRNLDRKPGSTGKKPKTHQIAGSLTVGEYYATKRQANDPTFLQKTSANPLTDWLADSKYLINESRKMTIAYFLLSKKYQIDKLYAFPIFRRFLP